MTPIGSVRSIRIGRVVVGGPGNEGGRRSWFVVAKQDGNWLLDLVETVSFNHVSVESGDMELKPRQLSPAEIEKIRSMDASTIR